MKWLLVLSAFAFPNENGVTVVRQTIPAWVNAQHCGANNTPHHIPKEAIQVGVDGYHIAGLLAVVPFNKVKASPDRSYWGFWNTVGEPNPIISCFFAPDHGA